MCNLLLSVLNVLIVVYKSKVYLIEVKGKLIFSFFFIASQLLFCN